MPNQNKNPGPPRADGRITLSLFLLALALVATLLACGGDRDEIPPPAEEEIRLVPLGDSQVMVFDADRACERLVQYNWDIDETKLAASRAFEAAFSAAGRAETSDTMVLKEASERDARLSIELRTTITAVNILEEKGNQAQDWCREFQ